MRNTALTRCCGYYLAPLLCVAQSLASTPEVSESVHGGVALVDISEYPDVSSVTFESKEQLIVGDYAVVAIPLDTQTGDYEVEIAFGSADKKLTSVTVLDKEYPAEYITVKDQEQVTPSQSNLDRIGKESRMMRDVYKRFSPQPSELLPLVQPVEGRNSGVFGSRRFFNGQPRNPHSGIDWAAPTGTPIKNPAPGIVALTGEFFFNGRTVMIDHGGGFISMMCHLNEISVVVDQQLERGEVLGTVGTTGRSTGPHLHWTISLNETRVDPAVFLERLGTIN